MDLDPADIGAGIALLVAIPFLAYVVLSMAGMPVSRSSKGTFGEQLAEAELFKDRRPPYSEPEVKEQLDYLMRLLDDRASLWAARSAKETDPVDVQRFLEYSLQTLGFVEGQLGVIDADVKGNEALGRYHQQIASAQKRIEETRVNLINTVPFVDIKKRLLETYGKRPKDPKAAAAPPQSQ